MERYATVTSRRGSSLYRTNWGLAYWTGYGATRSTLIGGRLLPTRRPSGQVDRVSDRATHSSDPRARRADRPASPGTTHARPLERRDVPPGRALRSPDRTSRVRLRGATTPRRRRDEDRADGSWR